MGINTGPVYRVADINANRNVAGGGINIAQRVMDCGDAGHILVSKAVADVLGQLSPWPERLHDLGKVAVKHGVLVHIFNLYTEESGNPILPAKVRQAQGAHAVGRELPWKAYAIGFAAVLLAGILTGVLVNRYRNHGETGGGPAGGGTAGSGAVLRPRLAVLGFKNVSNRPEADRMSVPLTELLTHEMEAGDHLVTTPGEEVAIAKKDLALPDDTNYGADTVQRIHRRLHCDYILSER